jgi:hypothetical protein
MKKSQIIFIFDFFKKFSIKISLMKTTQQNETSFDSILLGLGFKDTKPLEINRQALAKRNIKSDPAAHSKEFLQNAKE